MKEKILVVDDEPQILDLIEFILSGKGYQVIKAKDGEKALRSFSIHKPQLVLLDIKLPDRDGIGVLREMRRLNDEAVIIMISAHGTIQLAIESMKSGAYDFIEKPFETDQLQLKVRNALEKIRLEEEISVLKWELGEKYRLKNIIGSSDSMKEVFTLMKKVINNDITVLIRGESGTGKEMVARAIHFNGPRREEPFVAVNLGAIPENLMESELFGHEKGAFTGADYQRIGRFEQAKNGTIFLDEIADLTPSVQGKLLRVLQEKEVQRLGGKKDIPINARVIAATSKNLEQLLQEGHFREDLYFRINVFSINLPPLRERGEDIIELAEYFIRKKRKSTHHPRTESLRLGEDAKKSLLNYRWPGNVRELENAVERALILTGENSQYLRASHFTLLGEQEKKQLNKDREVLPMEQLERKALSDALNTTGGNISEAARLLGISRDTMHRKIKKYRIKVAEFWRKMDTSG